MSQLITVPQISVPAAQLPVTIDNSAALALRQMAIVQDELPKYLLAPEVRPCCMMFPICTVRCCWPLCGIPAHGSLALTRTDFSLTPPYPFVQLTTLKQRAEKAARTAGRTPAGS